MQESNSVSLKIYLMEGKNIIEVRRFEVDHGVITNYDYIRERLKIAIPSLREKIFKLLWEDMDGDEVTISTDEELVIALSELKTDVCKFIVRLVEDNKCDDEAYIEANIPSFQNLFSHAENFSNMCPLFSDLQNDVNCSACKQPITDIRYRCLECPEYCQCYDCELKKLHPDHMMLRVSKNISINNLIPKGFQIFKNHLARSAGKCPGMGTFFHGRMGPCFSAPKEFSHGDKEKFSEKNKCGSRHHRKFRRHGHCDKNNHDCKNSSSNDESTPMQTECPFNDQMINNLRTLVETFLGGPSTQKPEATENTNETVRPSTSINSQDPIEVIDVDGPPVPASAEKSRRQEDNNAQPENSKDAKIKMALELLAEMGFSNDNQWLSRLLEHFGGDIVKTLDHLTLNK